MDIQGLLNYAYFYLKFRPRTKRELERYLLKKIKTRHWSQDDVKRALQELEEEGLINDGEFVDWFVSERSRHKPKSAFVLRGELVRYGVPKDTIDRYFEEHELDEAALAEEALRKAWRRFAALPSDEQFKRAVSFLARRGFSFEVSKKTIEKITKKEYNSSY